MTQQHMEFYAALDVQVIPLWGVLNGECRCKAGAACQNPGKHPKGKWKGEPTRLPGPTDNVGVATDTLVVLDFDTEASFDAMAASLPDTFVVRTAKGVHCWYTANPQRPIRSTVGWRPSVDIRAVGGLVVAPPSRTVKGTRYEPLNGLCTPAPCPEALLDVLPVYVAYERRTYIGAHRPVADTSLHFRPLVDRLIEQLALAVPGTRNLTLYKVASRLFELHTGGYVGQSARDELAEAAAQIGLDPEEIERTIGSGWRG
jgi:hypothetical protein